MLEFLRNKRIMVIVAHPDDELLGLGATMHKLIKEYNCEVRSIILGEGITSRSKDRDVEKWEKELQIHRKNISDAQKIIGYQTTGIYDLPDNRFDTIALLDIVKIIEEEKSKFLPEVIFTHHGGDLNIDHQMTFEAVVTATRPMNHEIVKTIITFETPSSTEWIAGTDPRQFSPNIFISVSKEDLDAKIKGMESYEFEKRQFPHPRSSEALKIRAQNWGVVTGKEYVEAFCLIRNID